MVSFYTNLFSKDDSVHINEGLVTSIIPSSVTFHENIMLISRPFIEEIQIMIYNMDGSSVHGLDGFTGIFFHTFWDIVGHYVCRAIH